MRLTHPFLRLRLTFDGARMAEEVQALDPALWVTHPQSFPGNTALLLVSRRGDPVDDTIGMPLEETEALGRCPYLRQVLAALGVTIGRSRLMRIAPGAQCLEHTDVHPYWDGHLRLHIPITTHEQVSFFCGYERVHMAPGECWTFDSARPHKVVNNSTQDRVHLVCDTVDVQQVTELAAEGACDRPLAHRPGWTPELKVEADWQPNRLEPKRPVFIIGPPRSGTSLLFEAMSRAGELFTIGGESHRLFERIPGLHPRAGGWISNALTAEHGTDEVRDSLLNSLYTRVQDRTGARPTGSFCWLEKTPKNILRIPFLLRLFPDARFVLMTRDPRETISSMIEGWRSGRFVTYRDLPGWSGPQWSFLLVPEWRALDGLPLGRLVAEQWARAADAMLDAVDTLGPSRCVIARYEQLWRYPDQTLAEICSRIGVPWDNKVDSLPMSAHTLTPPAPGKWKQNSSVIEEARELIDPVAARMAATIQRLEA
jgi:hypothetical protein